ncbi:MAG: hypothetical protein K2W96_24470 [Gemmataceae bacterium]|nr:hypothetical protein [Gemmataceae bacterium]
MGAGGKFDYDPATGFTWIDTISVTLGNALFSVVVPMFVKIEAPPAAPRTLDEAVKRLFDRLQTDGKLSLFRVNLEIASNRCIRADRREEAAALVILKSFILSSDREVAEHRKTFFGNSARTELTENDIKMYNFRRRMYPLLKADPHLAPILDTHPEYKLAHDLNEWYKLWTEEANKFLVLDRTKPDLNELIWGKPQAPADLAKQIRQGSVGDCGFLAGLTSAVSHMALVGQVYYTAGATGEDMRTSINCITSRATSVYRSLAGLDVDALRVLVGDLNARKKVMIACTPATFNDEQKKIAALRYVFANHAYAVTMIDRRGVITLRNPHNNKGPGGEEIELSISDFKALFIGLAHE